MKSKGQELYTSERNYGAFQRELSLPDGVDRDKIDASFAKGVLTVTLPKTTAGVRAVEEDRCEGGIVDGRWSRFVTQTDVGWTAGRSNPGRAWRACAPWAFK